MTLADGSRLGYAKLLLATGSSPRRLPVQGADLDGVLYLRTVQDSDRIKDAFSSASRVAVVGAGWIGLETAAAARAAGVEVTVLERAELPLLHVLGREVAQVFADLHSDHGVDLRFGVQVTEITGSEGTVDGVRLSDGTRIDADAVIVGIGIMPNTGLAQAAGLQVDNGILIDERLRTSVPGHLRRGRCRQRLPSPARTGASGWSTGPTRCTSPRPPPRRCSARTSAYDRVPYFFTDQYDLGMEYTGYAEPGGYDQVVFRGDLGARRVHRVLARATAGCWPA